MTAPRLVAILGSGELAPGMVAIHREILDLVPAGDPHVLLDTPFGFQENADALTEKIREHFAGHLGRDLSTATLRDVAAATPLEQERFAAGVESAEYVFAGPGSPSYAVRQWSPTPLADLLRAKLRDGGVLVFASAAAIALGRWALPVYEIYKVGEAPRWIDGLDVLAAAGLRCAVIPHYDNAEGGNHDTRFCFLGERRLTQLEAMLGPGALILGVDEHTAAVLDLEAGTVRVLGRGGMTLRRDGVSRVVAAGEQIGLDELRDRGSGSAELTGTSPAARRPRSGRTEEVSAAVAAALEGGDIDGVVAGLLDLDSIASRGGDESDPARSLLRRHIVRLGDLARRGAGDPRDRVAPFVDALISLRVSAREERRFDEADRVRSLLTACGVEVRDTHDGAEWRLHETAG